MSAKQRFECDQLIRFHHCDPAGIVFYPQYFVLFNEPSCARMEQFLV